MFPALVLQNLKIWHPLLPQDLADLETTQFLTRSLVGLTGLRLKLFPQSRPFVQPKRACILLPTGFREILGGLHLIDRLAEAYPKSRFDWIIAGQYRPLVASNKRINMLFSADPIIDNDVTLSQIRGLAARLRTVRYDTCFIPARSPILSYIALLAEIPQRVGLNDRGRAIGLTLDIPTARLEPPDHAARRLFDALGANLESEFGSSGFYPGDHDRETITEILVDEIGWGGQRPLVIVHPGGNLHGKPLNEESVWPLERYVLFINYLIRKYNACVVLAGNEGADETLCEDAAGLVVGKVHNLASRLSWGEIGALAEIGSLFVGNDSDLAHLAASVRCPVMVILGENNAITESDYRDCKEICYVSAAFVPPFNWQSGVTLQQATDILEENKLL